jgi:hypothetical protein
MTENERIWQWLDSHWDQFLEYWQTKTKDLSQADVVTYDANRIVGIMADWVYQGVRKVVMVTPASLITGLTSLNDALRQRCEIAASAAENAASYATTEGNYAKSIGDQMALYIEEITDLKARVKQQGDTAENQGNRAQSIYESVSAWYNPFRDEVETWYSGETVAWNRFKNSAQSDFALWTEAESTRKSSENERIAHENVRTQSEQMRVTEESARVLREQERESNEEERQANEQLRQSAEGERQTVFEQTQADRQQAFEDAEAERMAAMLLTHFEVDPDTGCLMAYMTENDPTNYFIRNGYMMAEIEI